MPILAFAESPAQEYVKKAESLKKTPVVNVSPDTYSGLKMSYAEAISRVAPAVVNIFTEKVVAPRGAPFFQEPFFEQFFGHQMGRARGRVERSLGSGIIVSPYGDIVTNLHVIKGATGVRVTFHDGREVPVEFVSADESQDIAVLRMQLPKGEKVSHVRFADSDITQVGDVVLAIGNPYGFGQSVSLGIVSGLGRNGIGNNPYANFIQTDAAINPGNSGGALIDTTGRVIGLNTAIFSRSGGSQGIGFAVPAKLVQAILKSVWTTGDIKRIWLGVTGQNLTNEMAFHLGLDKPSGVLIKSILPNSPAEKADVRIGDVLLEVNGLPVMHMESLSARVAVQGTEKPVPFTLWREGKAVMAKVLLSTLPARKEADRWTVSNRGGPFTGYTVEQLSPSLSDEVGLPLESEGVAVIQLPSETHNGFWSLNLRKGDVIESVNGERVRTLEDFKRLVTKATRRWQVVYKRGGLTHRVVIQG